MNINIYLYIIQNSYIRYIYFFNLNNIMNINELETGDIILFSGNYFISNIIEFITNSKYSHIAVIIKNPNFFDDKMEGIYMLESGYEDKPDSENDRIKFGVQLTKLEDVIKSYKGDIFIRKLSCIRDESFYKKIDQIHSDVHNLPYDLNIFDWIKAGLHLKIGNVQKKNTYWCSALVCFIYVNQFFTRYITWTLISPKILIVKKLF